MAGNQSTPAQSLAVITPSDSVALPGGVCKSIWVGGAGNVVILAENDTVPVTLTAVAAGTFLSIRAQRINATSTTATNMVAFY